jgi:hypothetical protein
MLTQAELDLIEATRRDLAATEGAAPDDFPDASVSTVDLTRAILETLRSHRHLAVALTQILADAKKDSQCR